MLKKLFLLSLVFTHLSFCAQPTELFPTPKAHTRPLSVAQIVATTVGMIGACGALFTHPNNKPLGSKYFAACLATAGCIVTLLEIAKLKMAKKELALSSTAHPQGCVYKVHLVLKTSQYVDDTPQATESTGLIKIPRHVDLFETKIFQHTDRAQLIHEVDRFINEWARAHQKDKEDVLIKINTFVVYCNQTIAIAAFEHWGMDDFREKKIDKKWYARESVEKDLREVFYLPNNYKIEQKVMQSKSCIKYITATSSLMCLFILGASNSLGKLQC